MAGTPHLTLGSGDTISTPDVNLLDADTAHMQQAIGLWGGSGGAPVVATPPVAPPFGTLAGKMIITANSPNDFASKAGFNTAGAGGGGDLEGLSPATEYTFLTLMAVDAVTSGDQYQGVVSINWKDAAGASLGWSESSGLALPIDQTWQLVFVTATSPASTAKARLQIVTKKANAGTGFSFEAGDILYASSVCFREGPDTTFQPSQDIQGTVDETIDPVGCAVSYAKGTGTVIGTAWSGDFVSYVKRDGTDGPIVLACYPEDVYG